MQRIFQNLQTLAPVVVGTTKATVSAITDHTHEHNSRKRPKTREDSAMMILYMKKSTASSEPESIPNTKSISDNYNQVKELGAAQPHDAQNTLNKTIIKLRPFCKYTYCNQR